MQTGNDQPHGGLPRWERGGSERGIRERKVREGLRAEGEGDPGPSGQGTGQGVGAPGRGASMSNGPEVGRYETFKK